MMPPRPVARRRERTGPIRCRVGGGACAHPAPPPGRRAPEAPGRSVRGCGIAPRPARRAGP